MLQFNSKYSLKLSTLNVFCLLSFLMLKPNIWAQTQNPSPYVGSSFSEVAQALLAKPYLSLPKAEIKWSSAFGKAIEASAKRTLSEPRDLLPRFDKLVHPTGICWMGLWKIDRANPYSGLFKVNTKALFIGRSSVAFSETTRGHNRGFGLAGKVFPTVNPFEKVKTANFFLIDNLSGTKAEHYTDVAMTNEPEVSINSTVFWNIELILNIGRIFLGADRNPGFRPLYPLSETNMSDFQAEIPAENSLKTPIWMKVEVNPSMRKVEAQDFRDELKFPLAFSPKGLIYDIYVSDRTRFAVLKNYWSKIGHITLAQSVASEACDHHLHFQHPKIK